MELEWKVKTIHEATLVVSAYLKTLEEGIQQSPSYQGSKDVL